VHSSKNITDGLNKTTSWKARCFVEDGSMGGFSVQNQRTRPMTERLTDYEKPPGPLGLIDIAVSSAKHAAHSCRNETARELFEFALALLRESWIAEDGQQARGAAKVIEDVRWTQDLFTRIFDQQQQEGN